MPISTLETFDLTVDRIKRQQPFGLACYTFLKSIVGNDARHEKFNGSYGGHAVDLSIRSIQSSLILFCSRHWDQPRPDMDEQQIYQSIPAIGDTDSTVIDEIVDRHQEEFDRLGFDRDAQEFRQYFDGLSQEIDATSSSLDSRFVRVHRTEQLAHQVASSRDRLNARRDHPDFDLGGFTVEKLLEFSEKTLRLGEKIIYFRERLVPSFDDRVENFEQYYDRFWDCLPVFADVEDPL